MRWMLGTLLVLASTLALGACGDDDGGGGAAGSVDAWANELIDDAEVAQCTGDWMRAHLTDADLDEWMTVDRADAAAVNNLPRHDEFLAALGECQASVG